MVEKKKKKEEEVGTPRLREIELKERLALKGTLDGMVMDEEIADRITELEKETSASELEKELGEAEKVKKKVKR